MRAFDLFCGAGGSSLGAQAGGAEIVGAVDSWPPAVATYRTNFPRARVFHAEAQTVDLNALAQAVGKIDLLLASPPCVGHSVARGAKSPDAASNAMAWEVVRYARALKPRWVVVENVAAMKKWPEFNRWRKDLMASLGGVGASWGTRDAADFGVPQNRERLFLVVGRGSDLPSPTHSKAISVKKILLPAESTTTTPLFTPNRARRTLQRVLHAAWLLGRVDGAIISFYGNISTSARSLTRPLPTVTCTARHMLVRFDSSPAAPQVRMLQQQEIQAAMGFPPDFTLCASSQRDAIRLLGNAVCPPVMRALISSLLR